jgi:hypothetical protein
MRKGGDARGHALAHGPGKDLDFGRQLVSGLPRSALRSARGSRHGAEFVYLVLCHLDIFHEACPARLLGFTRLGIARLSHTRSCWIRDGTFPWTCGAAQGSRLLPLLRLRHVFSSQRMLYGKK